MNTLLPSLLRLKRLHILTSRNNGKWTESKFNSFIKSALRAASSRWPPKYQCLANSYTRTGDNPTSGRQAKLYRCADCGGEFSSTNVQVDHIQPVIDPNVGFIDWDEVIKRMFCEEDGFQVLCKPCHKIKTDAEKALAKERKKKNK